MEEWDKSYPSSSKDILFALGRLEGKVDALMAQAKMLHTDIEQHDNRIRSLENSKAFLVGICGVCAAVVSYCVTLFAETI